MGKGTEGCTIVNRAVYETGCKTAGEEKDVGVFGVDVLMEKGGYLGCLGIEHGERHAERSKME